MASTHQRKDIGDDSRVVHWSEVVTGTIVSVYSNNTADVTISGVGAVSAVPIFYHCPDDPSVSNGYNAFSQNDSVIILAEKDKLSDTPDYTIIGFTSTELKDCALNIVIRFVPTSSGYADDKCFVWNVNTNTYLPLGGFTAHDNLYNWDEVGTFLNSKKVNDVEPCYTYLGVYGINENDFNGDGAIAVLPPPVQISDCGNYGQLQRSGNVSDTKTYAYSRPDGMVENSTEVATSTANYTYIEEFNGNYWPSHLFMVNGVSSASKRINYPSYKSIYAPSPYNSSSYWAINTESGKNNLAFFPFILNNDGYTENACTLDYHDMCGWWYFNAEYHGHDGLSSLRIGSPIGTSELHPTPQFKRDEYGHNSPSWYFIQTWENSSTYHYHLNHINNGFYKKIMYQVSTGITMRTANSATEEFDADYKYPDNPFNSVYDTIHDMHVACIASCNTFSGMATYHDPTTQNRNTNFETAIISLVQNSTKQSAIDNSQIPGNVEVFVARV